MSSCLSGTGARTYGLDLDLIKSPPCSWSRTSQTSSSPSSTISESSNSPLAIYTTKPRNPRKRPNQTYNEAATLLSTAYPNLFSNPNLKTNPNNKFHKPLLSSEKSYESDSSELLLPFRVFDTSSSFLLHSAIHQSKVNLNFPSEPKPVKPCQSPGEISSMVNLLELNDDGDDFDAESILDEEIEESIDSIMGGRIQEDESKVASSHHLPWIGLGGKIDFRLGLQRAGVRALRHVDEGNWWNFPAVDMLKISPKICSVGGKTPAPVTEKKKKKKVVVVMKQSEALKETELPKAKSGLLLKLNYDGVRKAWSDRGTPFADDSPVSDVSGNDVNTRLSQIDLLWENNGGGVREASVQRYKEKRRTRLFSKKIRYQVRKVNADRRPRMKGRFVRRLNAC
ncbi:protein CHLOROPLAST IMPORT APPARATUS 2-like [Vicia villosa]|uniref:protein CHLOROPLAST IMPORT APPARATUS 2-like n=1 Tax=Vicia villosa TaxID=3911 RepID=UPI00273CE49E|nr:protein CHLOROPLAST IMPORT APPARATUS 2-like [Vicia villosa]